MSPDFDSTCAGGGAGNLYVCYSALELSSVYSSICNAANFLSKLDFLSFRYSFKYNSHLEMEILWICK